MSHSHNAIFVIRADVTDKKPRPSGLINILRPRVSLDVDLLKLLDGSEIKLWLLLRELQRGRPHIALDQTQIASLLDTTQSSVSRRIKTLRALRVLAFLPASKRSIRGLQRYIVFDAQQDVETILSIDDQYIVFIHEYATKSGNKRLRQLCKEEIFALPQGQYDVYLALPQEQNELSKLRQKIHCELQIDGKHSQTTTDAVPLCTDESPLCKNELRKIQTLTQTTTDAAPLCTDESPLCKNELRKNQTLTQTTTDAAPLCTDESPLCKNELRKNQTLTPKNLPQNRGYIYNHARAPTQIRIKSFGFNDNHPSKDGGCGGKDGASRFAFLEERPYRLLIDQLVDLYGNHNAHAVLNALKRGRYTYKSEQFRHTVNADEAAIILVSLIDRSDDKPIVSPLNFVTKLIFQASKDQLFYLGTQYSRFLELTGQNKIKSSNKQLDKDTSRDRGKSKTINLNDGIQLVGKSGEMYEIKNQILCSAGEMFARPNKVDGVGPGVIDITEVERLITIGKLKILNGGKHEKC